MEKNELGAALCGVAYLTGTTALSLATSLPVAFVRKTAKTYGTCRLAEGPDIEGRQVLIVEDVITSGGQVVESARELIARGAQLTGAICVIDREEGGREALAEIGIELTALFTKSELVQWMVA